jgi:hypothetical protein
MQAFVPRDIFGTTGSSSKKLLVNNGLHDIHFIHKENVFGAHDFKNKHIQGPPIHCLIVPFTCDEFQSGIVGSAKNAV